MYADDSAFQAYWNGYVGSDVHNSIVHAEGSFGIRCEKPEMQAGKVDVSRVGLFSGKNQIKWETGADCEIIRTDEIIASLIAEI